MYPNLAVPIIEVAAYIVSASWLQACMKISACIRIRGDTAAS